jgi:endo-1,4-beta-xylanase
MLKKGRKLILLLLLSVYFIGVNSCNKDESPLDEYNNSDEGLKDYYTPDDYFYMGVAMPPSFVDNQKKADLIKRHFNSVTAENDMKWSNLQPTEGTFTFTNRYFCRG